MNKDKLNKEIKSTAALGPWAIAWRNLRRHRLAMLAGKVLIAMYVIMLFDGFFAPYNYNTISKAHPYHTPMNLRFIDSEGKFHLRPFVYKSSYEFDNYNNRVWIADDTAEIFPVKFFARGDETTIFFGLIKTDLHLFTVDAPGRIYLLGADFQGRDIFSRLIFSGRVSLTIGLVGTLISMTIGMLVGGISGYVGGFTDGFLQRTCELIMLIPGLYTLMILYHAFPDTLSSVQMYFAVVIILSFIGWAGLARVIRGMVLSVKNNDYVVAARAMGMKPLRIVVRHVLPSTFSYAIVAASLRVPAYILGESGLSMIGMGIQEPIPSWGNMLAMAIKLSELKTHPWLLWPGVAIFVTVMAFNFLGDGLRDALDPRGAMIKS